MPTGNYTGNKSHLVIIQHTTQDATKTQPLLLKANEHSL